MRIDLFTGSMQNQHISLQHVYRGRPQQLHKKDIEDLYSTIFLLIQ